MAAQPVDTNPPAAHASVRDNMSPSVAKGTQHMEINSDAKSDASLSFSEGSPGNTVRNPMIRRTQFEAVIQKFEAVI